MTHFYDVTWLIFETLCPAATGISWKGKDGNMSFDQLKQQIYENDFATLNVLKGQIVDNESIFMFPQVTNIGIL